MLTSQGRMFYAGNFYKANCQEDEYSTEFVELNTNKQGAVRLIKSYITGFGFVTADSKLYLLGNFGNVTYDEPYMVHSSVSSFDINDNGAYIVDTSGDLHLFSFAK